MGSLFPVQYIARATTAIQSHAGTEPSGVGIAGSLLELVEAAERFR